MPARGLTRKITRKQARSYTKLTPNPLGVTTLSVLSNGRRKRRSTKSKSGSTEYKKLYSDTKALLHGSAKKGARTMKKKLKGAAFKRSAQYKAMMAGRAKWLRKSKKSAPKRRRTRRNPFETGFVAGRGLHTGGYEGLPMAKSSSSSKAKGSGQKAVAAAKRQASAITRAAAAERVAKAKKRKAAAAKREANERKRVGKSYGPGAKKSKATRGRTFKSLKATIGGRTRPSYAYAGRGGKPKKIPLWAILGAKSQKDLERRVATDSSLARNVVAAKKRRDSRAARLQARGDFFTPNAVSFETWSQNMKPNKRKAKRRSKGRSPAQKAATKKMIAAARRANKKHTPKRRRARKNTATPNRRRRTRKNATPNRRSRVKGGRRARRAAPRRTHKKHSKYTMHKVRGFVKSRRKKGKKTLVTRVRGSKKHKALVRTLNSRAKARGSKVRYYENRKRRHHKRNATPNRRRHYRRNPAWLDQIKSVVEIGAIVTVGFVAHRALSTVVSEQLLAKVAAFQTGALASYRGVIAGALVAGIGIVAAAKLAPKHAAKLGAGMITSLLHKTLVTLLANNNQVSAAGYLSGYPDASGNAYRYLDGGGYNGVGEYLQMNGMGEYLQMNGFGSTMQAAAGYGALPMQAAAGIGYDQAAAGMGEYIMTGLRGIGEYEQASAGVGSSADCYTDNGVNPDADSAEDALTMAENMSGIGDAGYSSTVTPTIQGQGISDAPGGDRAGVLQGPGGIFS